MEFRQEIFIMKKISVIMAVYKESKEELDSAIKSILNQTYSNFEFIIVIDNPDEKWRIKQIKDYNDDRIILLINEKNIGLPKSLNKGLKKASGYYIARMDADDISLPNRFERQINFLEKYNYDMCGSYVSCFINDSDFQKIKFPIFSESVNKMMYIKNCLAHPTYMVKKSVYDNLNYYHNIFSCEDYDFLFRVVNNNYKVGNVPEVLLRYRITPKSISRSNAGKQELIAIFLKKYYKKNKCDEVSEDQISDYLNSEKFIKKLKSYDYYWSMKNTRSKYKENKFPMFYIYTILLVLNFKHSIKEIYRKIYEKAILDGENNNVNTKSL